MHFSTQVTSQFQPLDKVSHKSERDREKEMMMTMMTRMRSGRQQLKRKIKEQKYTRQQAIIALENHRIGNDNLRIENCFIAKTLAAIAHSPRENDKMLISLNYFHN